MVKDNWRAIDEIARNVEDIPFDIIKGISVKAEESGQELPVKDIITNWATAKDPNQYIKDLQEEVFSGALAVDEPQKETALEKFAFGGGIGAADELTSAIESMRKGLSDESVGNPAMSGMKHEVDPLGKC